MKALAYQLNWGKYDDFSLKIWSGGRRRVIDKQLRGDFSLPFVAA